MSFMLFHAGSPNLVW